MEHCQTFQSSQNIKLWQIYKKLSCMSLFPSDDYLFTTPSALHDPPSSPHRALIYLWPYHIIPTSQCFFCLSLQRQTDLSWSRFKGWEHSRHWRKGRQHPPNHGGEGVWLWEGRRARRQVPVQWGHTLETLLLSVWVPGCSDWNGHKKWNLDLTNTPHPRPPPTTSWCLRLALWHDQSGHGQTLRTAQVTLNTCAAITNHNTTI